MEKVKKRREEREREKAAREEERTLMQREKEASLFSVCFFLKFCISHFYTVTIKYSLTEKKYNWYMDYYLLSLFYNKILI